LAYKKTTKFLQKAMKTWMNGDNKSREEIYQTSTLNAMPHNKLISDIIWMSYFALYPPLFCPEHECREYCK
jgi:hypothetical protein